MKQFYGENYRQNQRFFKHSIDDSIHENFNVRTMAEIKKRKTDFDIVLFFWGVGHYKLAKQLDNNWAVVEPSVSYSQSFAPNRVFASYSIMNVHYTQEKKDPGFWDTVIPHYVDPEEFIYSKDKEDYAVFLGRIIPSKGISLIIDVAKKFPDYKFLIAGNGHIEKNQIPHNIEFIGVVKGEDKSRLLSKAKFLIAPSFYNEPFGLIVPEALMSGTPVITTDWGGFVENNRHEITGYRCRTYDQFLHAIRNINKIKSEDCRDFAIKHFSIDYARKRYIDYFKIIEKRYKEGYYYEFDEFLDSTYEFTI